MENVEPQEGMADFPIAGSNEVENPCFVCHSALDAESTMNREIAGHARNDVHGQACNDIHGHARNDVQEHARNDVHGHARKDEEEPVSNAGSNNGRIFINNTQYFDHVPSVTWNFYIGGYQPAQKWLKDRKGRTLGYDDILHYQKIIRVLQETAEIQNEIDNNNQNIQ